MIKTICKFSLLGVILVLFTAISCSKGKSGQRAGGIREYPVITVNLQSTQMFQDYPATLQGEQTVDIRPKIAGYIEQILVDEGAHVKKGQLLFRLNDNDLQATVRSAEAAVKVAEADVFSARLKLEQTKPLADKNIVSQYDLQSAQSLLKAKEAQLAQARANLENARANLQYAMITSPADGTIGTFAYRVGSLVSSSSPDPLTSISNTSRMYAYFSINEKVFLTLTRGWKGKSLKDKLSGLKGITLLMADNSVYEHPGKIDMASGLVDPQTGAVSIRASFPNPEALLRSGSSGVVRIPELLDSVILVPQKSTYELQGKHFIYVVGPDNKVHDTEIEVLTGNLKNSYVVTKGLHVGDKVVLEGIVSLRDQNEIKPKLVQAGSLSENMPDATQVKP